LWNIVYFKRPAWLPLDHFIQRVNLTVMDRKAWCHKKSPFFMKSLLHHSFDKDINSKKADTSHDPSTDYSLIESTSRGHIIQWGVGSKLFAPNRLRYVPEPFAVC
jgi:hypothetical protein